MTPDPRPVFVRRTGSPVPASVVSIPGGNSMVSLALSETPIGREGETSTRSRRIIGVR